MSVRLRKYCLSLKCYKSYVQKIQGGKRWLFCIKGKKLSAKVLLLGRDTDCMTMKLSILILISFMLLVEEMHAQGAYPIWHAAHKKWQEENGASGDSEDIVNTELGYDHLEDR